MGEEEGGRKNQLSFYCWHEGGSRKMADGVKIAQNPPDRPQKVGSGATAKPRSNNRVITTR